jgi:hypothetical protein
MSAGTRLRELGARTGPPARVRENLLVPDNRFWWASQDLSRWEFDFGGPGFPLGFGAYGGYPADRSQDKSHAPLPYLTEVEYFRHLSLSRDLVATNDLAIGFRSRVRQYVGPVTVSFVLAGQSPGAGAAGPTDADGNGVADAPLQVLLAQDAWDEFCRVNDWGCGVEDREEECIDRTLYEGEVTVALFKGAPGEVPRARFIDPEFIRSPVGASTDDPEYMGVIASPRDPEEWTGILVQYDPEDDSKEFDRTRCVRQKRNVVRSSKRGLSDFFPSAETLRKTTELIDNMGVTAGVQSKYAWMEKFGPAVTMAQANAMIAAGADYSAIKVNPLGGNKTVSVTRDPPGTIKRTEHDREVAPGPTATPEGFLAIVDAAMRRVSIRFGLPPNFIWASADSFASVLVTNAPFVMEIQERQKRQQGFTEELVRRVLALCEESGRLPRGVSRVVRPVCDSAPVVTADEEKQARTELALFGQGLADPLRIMRENKDDPKIVYANLAAHRKKLAQMGGQPGQQPPPGAPPTEPGGGSQSTPPGSAGGDGSSPNDDPFGGVFGESKDSKGHEHGEHGRFASAGGAALSADHVVAIYDRTASAKHSEINAAVRAIAAMSKKDAEAVRKRVDGMPGGDPRRAAIVSLLNRKGSLRRHLTDKKEIAHYAKTFADEPLLTPDEALAPKKESAEGGAGNPGGTFPGDEYAAALRDAQSEFTAAEIAAIVRLGEAAGGIPAA